jgi:hypothetical protein
VTAHSSPRLSVILSIVFCVSFGSTRTQAQGTNPAPTQAQLQSLASRLAAAEKRLQQSQQEMERLREQISEMQNELSALHTPTATPAPATTPVPTAPLVAGRTTSSSSSTADIKEQLAMIQSQVEQHDQIKIESASKYPVRLTGLVLFNAFSNHGGVDNFDQPGFAIPQSYDTPSQTFGASLRQTILGIQANGPHLAGASSYAEVNMDFYGGIPSSNSASSGGNNYGSGEGIVRMRTALASLLWNKDTVEAGFVTPFISPLSPTSYASVAEPAMAGAGNLWVWAPQLRYLHRFDTSSRSNFSWEFGLWDPPSAGYTNTNVYRTPSAGERSGQPAYESRISWNRGEPNSSGQWQLGLGGYYSRMAYTGRNGDSYAVTGDWKVPLTNHFEISGEAYRGRAIGGLGGGVYKNVVTGNDPITGASTFRLLNDAGGWAQAKFRFTNILEANAAFGLDNGFSRDFHSLILPSDASGMQLRARNQMWSANLIYTPKTYLIFSPEFRHIRTFNINSNSSSADIFTLSLGYRF